MEPMREARAPSRMTEMKGKARTRYRRALATVASLTMAGAVGCAHRAVLRPAPQANAVAGLARAAVSTIDGVRVTAQADAWPGDPDITRYVTPIKLRVRNGGKVPLLLRYQDFAVVAEDGTRHAALPPYELTGAVERPALGLGFDPIESPLFYHRGFLVAPYYAPVYPGLELYDRPFYYDPLYFDHYFGLWIEYPLPTPEMLAQALPEGIIETGGEVAGFLYFERVRPREKRVRFRADLTNARNGREFGEVSIPFNAVRASSQVAAGRAR
jgi:hypothetical protein